MDSGNSVQKGEMDGDCRTAERGNKLLDTPSWLLRKVEMRHEMP